MDYFKKNSSKIIFIFTFSILLHVLVFPLVRIAGDEGIRIHQAILFGQGLVPVADYSARAPILIILTDLSLMFFGRNLFAARLPVLLASALIAVLIFLLARAFCSERAGWYAAAFYVLSPFVLWRESIIKIESFSIMFTLLALLSLHYGITRHRRFLIFFAGISLGLAYLERQSALAAMLAFTIYLIWGRYILMEVLIFWAGMGVGFLPIFLWIFSHNAVAAGEYWLGLIWQIFNGNAWRQNVTHARTSFYLQIRTWGLAFIEGLALEGWLLFSGMILFFILLIKRYFKYFERWIISALLIIVYGALVFHSLHIWFVAPNFRPEVFLLMMISALLIIISFLQFIFSDNFKFLEHLTHLPLFLLVWFLILIIAYTIWDPGYIREFIPIVAIMSGIAFSQFPFRDLSLFMKVLFIFGVLSFWISGGAWFLNPKGEGWYWTQSEMRTLESFIEKNSAPGEDIFTANPLPVVLAGRGVFEDVSPFGFKFAPSFEEQFFSYPSPAEVLKELISRPPRYVVIDKRMTDFVFKFQPPIREFVSNNYREVNQIGSSKILLRKDLAN